MDKNRFYLIILLGIVILTFLFNTYKNIKKEAFEEYKNFQSLSQKIDEILYLQKKYKNPIIIKKLNRCKITQTDKYKIECKNLSKKEFSKISNLIFNNSLNIIKFSIKSDKTFYIYVEIEK